jgi:NAD+ synthase (glutamine-hydrolysing)
MNFIDRIAVAQVNMHVGNFKENTSKIISNIEEARKLGKSVMVFPELSVCGYPPRDFLEFQDFIDQAQKAVNEILEYTEEFTVIIGVPTINSSKRGKRLHNSAVIISDKTILGYAHKSLLPNYDVFDEYRYFEPNYDFDIFEIHGEKVGVTICEDIWNVQDQKLYSIDPVEELVKIGATTIINLSASPFSVNQQVKRKEVIRENAIKYGVHMVYSNYVGAQTELIFDGGSCFVNPRGEFLSEASYFTEAVITSNMNAENKLCKEEAVFQALKTGVQDYFRKLGFQKAIIGLSGGIDSAVTYAIAVEALGAENVLGVLMPSQYSSNHSVQDAKNIIENYNGVFELFTIESLYGAYEEKLEKVFEGLPFGLAEENLQARLRGVLLMALSNKFGYILLNTSNKSEAAVGYGTLYGDMCGGLSVLGDVYKTDVFALAKWINRKKELIPWNTINKPPSAELRPNQKDSDSLPDYDILDKILKEYIENRKGPNQIIEIGYSKEEVLRILKMVNINEHKRYQTPPILRVSDKAFGMGRRLPIVAKYLS